MPSTRPEVDDEVLRELENARKIVRSKDKEWARRSEAVERAVAGGLIPELLQDREMASFRFYSFF